MKFSEIIKQNEFLKNQLSNRDKIDLIILTNITVNQLVPILEFELRNSGLNAFIQPGEYDNILQTSEIVKNEIPIVFWELSNLKESFVYEVELFSEDILQKYIDKTIQELMILFNNLSKSKLVIFNKFSHIIFSKSILKKGTFENFVNSINHFIEENLPKNFILIDIDKVIANLGINNVCNFRNYYLTKSLYTVDFFVKYSHFIAPAILALFGKSKKAIIFDCDNTLWNGVVGEDGPLGIELSEKSKKGIYFKEIQLLAKSLSRKGVILCLCSKNNENDVNEVFETRKDMELSLSDIVIKKINWIDKSSNLIAISQELNIGIDSFVFIDDSSFEIELIKEKNPEVYTLQVPLDISSYPIKLLELTNRFYSNNLSKEDLDRAKMYIQDKERQTTKQNFESLEEYLGSLQIKIEISNKDEDSKERIAQLTQKTNQFNLTTKRNSISDINHLFDLENHDILSLKVSDKFGDNGITGICIIVYTQDEAIIDSLLMSCRVLGRNIEKAFIYEIIKHINEKGKKKIFANYKRTLKNKQTEFFYENNNFKLIEETSEEKKYSIDLKKEIIETNKINYITTIWKKK